MPINSNGFEAIECPYFYYNECSHGGRIFGDTMDQAVARAKELGWKEHWSAWVCPACYVLFYERPSPAAKLQGSTVAF